MTEILELILERLGEIPGEHLAPEPYGVYFRTLSAQILKVLGQTGWGSTPPENPMVPGREGEASKTRSMSGKAETAHPASSGRPRTLLQGQFDRGLLEATEATLPEGLLKEVLFAVRLELEGLCHRHIAEDGGKVENLVGLFLEVYGAFSAGELPDAGALLQDFRSYVLDYLPEQALFYVQRELDLFEEASLPASPSGIYQEHLLAMAAAVVGHWRVHLANAKQTIIGKETASISADPETLPVAAYVRRMLSGLGVRSSVLLRPPELSLSAPWIAECGCLVQKMQPLEAEDAQEMTLGFLPKERERVLALVLDESYVSRRLRAEEEALREVGNLAFAGHVGTLRIVSAYSEEGRAPERTFSEEGRAPELAFSRKSYFTEAQRELYLSLCRKLASIRSRYMKARPFLFTVSAKEAF